MAGDIEQWIAETDNQGQNDFRRVVHIILNAISSHHEFQPEMIMKGGILMAIAYHSGRFTKDIDFSTPKHYYEFQKGQAVFIENLNSAIKLGAEETNYGIACSIQSSEIRPGPTGNYQTLHLSIGYSYKSDTNSMRRLSAGQATKIVKLDYSFNETVGDFGIVDAGGTEGLQTYGKLTLIAEKYRALLQQASVTGGRARGSDRGQDVYDIYTLLTKYPITDDQKIHLLQIMVDKAKSRELVIDRSSILDPTVASRAKNRYENLVDEIDGELLNFDAAFNELIQFYVSLPWDQVRR